MDRVRGVRLLFSMLAALSLAGCADSAAPGDATGRAPRAVASAAEGPGRPVPARAPEQASPPAAQGAARWFAAPAGGAGAGAAWGVPDSEPMLSASCEPGSRLRIERSAEGLPASLRLVTIEADGTAMAYPAERVETTLGAVLVTRLALDAPMLDRMLDAATVTLHAGDDALVMTGTGAALRRLVAACRDGA